ncbi:MULTISPECIES: hypothetical protein [Pseudomonadaceae]|uniref:hypothetical protein n=1 Tax=Pseudomonadaceae TaxID=135621 RepID=UPI0006B281E0|nr:MULTISPECIES: hypothetical protein [Pseudomonadaceae]
MTLAINFSSTILDSFDFPQSDARSVGHEIQSYASYDIGTGALLAQTHKLSQFAKRSKLLLTLEEYGKLQFGWDGYSGEAATRESITDARLFISVLPERFDLPVPMLACDGEISLYWETASSYLEASLPGDGTFHYIFNNPSKRVASDDIEISVPNINKEFLGCLEEL